MVVLQVVATKINVSLIGSSRAHTYAIASRRADHPRTRVSYCPKCSQDRILSAEWMSRSIPKSNETTSEGATDVHGPLLLRTFFMHESLHTVSHETCPLTSSVEQRCRVVTFLSLRLVACSTEKEITSLTIKVGEKGYMAGTAIRTE